MPPIKSKVPLVKAGRDDSLLLGRADKQACLWSYSGHAQSNHLYGRRGEGLLLFLVGAGGTGTRRDGGDAGLCVWVADA